MSFFGWSELKPIMKDFFKSFFKKKDYGCYSKQVNEENKDKKILKNIYGVEDTMEGYAKGQNIIHYNWKHRFIYPLLWAGKKLLGKYLVKEMPDDPHFKKIRIFDTAFDNACDDWCRYVAILKEKGRAGTDEEVKKKMSQPPITMLQVLKQFVLTISKNDTAYMEFMNILVMQIAIEMNKNCDEHEKHIIYTSNNISDAAYFFCNMKPKNFIDQSELASFDLLSKKIVNTIQRNNFEVKPVPRPRKANQKNIMEKLKENGLEKNLSKYRPRQSSHRKRPRH